MNEGPSGTDQEPQAEAGGLQLALGREKHVFHAPAPRQSVLGENQFDRTALLRPQVAGILQGTAITFGACAATTAATAAASMQAAAATADNVLPPPLIKFS